MTKSLDDFYTDRKARDGRRPECKACNLANRARKYRENPAPAIARTQRWRRENPERNEQRMREYAESGKKALADRKSHLNRKYGLSLEQYDAMLAAQGGVCAICHQPPARGTHAARRPRSRHRRDPRLAVFHLQQRAG